MSTPRPGTRRAPASDAATPSDLVALGLRVGDTVRFRRRPEERWREGTVSGREKDGSVGVRDARGAARALPASQLQVRRRGPRGGVVWEPLTEVAARTEQLGLL